MCRGEKRISVGDADSWGRLCWRLFFPSLTPIFPIGEVMGYLLDLLSCMLAAATTHACWLLVLSPVNTTHKGHVDGKVHRTV
jgi:hypothetical protein